MATTTILGITLPDDPDLVKDGADAMRYPHQARPHECRERE